jgi:hypothetical protein
MGHLERFRSERVSGRYQIGQGTSAGAYSGDGLAPKAVLPVNPRRPAAGMDLTVELAVAVDPKRSIASGSNLVAGRAQRTSEIARPVIRVESARWPISERRRGHGWLVGGNRSNCLALREGFGPR